MLLFLYVVLISELQHMHTHTCMLISVFIGFQYMCPPEFPHTKAQWDARPRGTAKQPAPAASDVPTALWTTLTPSFQALP